MTITYYQNGWIDISTYIDYSNDFFVTSRIDDAFESGSCKAWLSASKPIPAYTPFIIDGKQMYGSSETTKYLTQQSTYVHDISLLESTSILNCFIIGTKVYSKESPTWSDDKVKFLSLLRLAKRMYPEFTFTCGIENGTTGIAYLTNKITTSKTYTFDAKATLFDCLNEICIENDLKLTLTFSEANPTNLWIGLKNVNANTTISLSYPTLDQSKQDLENYGRYLETYASNVVDRDTISKVDHLDLKSDDIVLNADTAVLFTPTPIESIKEFGVHQTREIRIFIEGLENYFSSADLNSFVGYTYSQLMAIGKNFGGVTVYLFREFYDDYIAQYFPYVTKAYFGSTAYASNYTGGAFVITCPTACNGKFPIRIYEKAEWDTFTAQDQSTKPFYTIGSNKIENLNASYKNDLWNIIISQQRGNFLSDSANDETEHTTINDLTFYMISVNSNQTDIFQYLYWVDYYAITNPYIRDTKTSTPENESSFKEFGRSYGISTNFIDFNKLVPNMSVSNNTLGQVEKVLEYDVTSANTMPSAGYTMTYDNTTWYISNVTTKYKINQKIATLTLVKNYQKKAESIGVDSQSESTNNPLKGIVTRPIYIEKTTSVALSNYTSDPMFIKFTFYDTSGTLITTTDSDSTTVSSLIMRCSVQAFGSKALFYTEALDQMVLDYGRGNYSTMTFYNQKPFPYTDSNAECGQVKVELGTMTQTTQGLLFFLPSGYGGSFTSKLNFGYIRLDKDARERLTFSLLVKSTA